MFQHENEGAGRKNGNVGHRESCILAKNMSLLSLHIVKKNGRGKNIIMSRVVQGTLLAGTTLISI